MSECSVARKRTSRDVLSPARPPLRKQLPDEEAFSAVQTGFGPAVKNSSSNVSPESLNTLVLSIETAFDFTLTSEVTYVNKKSCPNLAGSLRLHRVSGFRSLGL